MQKTFLGLLRISLGFIFLWAFFDKLFGLGFATATERAWVSGGSPTTGFLKGVEGTFAPFFNSLAGNMWVDWLFMAGLLLIGVAFVLGIASKLATIGGSLMLFLMYLAVFPPTTNPILDDHIIYILVLLVLYYSHAGETLGFGKDWAKSDLVKHYPILA